MHPRKLASLAGVLLLTAACADLSVENPNEPDTGRVVAEPNDLVSLVGGAYNTWWTANYSTDIGWFRDVAPMVVPLSTVADAHSASWGNFFMRELSAEPRQALNNSTSSSNAPYVEWGWYQNYAALKAVNDGLRGLDGGVKLGEREPMVRAFAKFVQGLALGQLALIYDQAFIYDEKVTPADVAKGLQLKPYGEVMAAAVASLQEAARIASANQFTTPANWVNRVPVSNRLLAQLAHSYIARFMAGVARTPAERQSVNWNAVVTHARQGITADFGPMGEEGFYNSAWWDMTKSFGGGYESWSRMDLRFYGMADTDGDYQAWLAKPAAQRTPFLIHTPDRRITGATPTSDGTHVRYAGACPFNLSRGTYHCSNYADARWWEYHDGGPDQEPTFTIQLTAFMPEELWLLEAEGLLRTGNAAGAAALINRTRVPAGLPPVTAAGVPGTAPNCVPQEPTPTPTCGTLLRAIHWEKWVETYHTGNTEFFDARGWGFLVPGSILHVPVPAAELQVLGLPVYTFGGVGNPGSASETPTPGGMAFGRVSGTPRFLSSNIPIKTGAARTPQ